MKSFHIIIACYIFVLASVSPACKKNQDLQLPEQSLTVNAGQDKSIALPVDSVILDGTAVSIGGTVISYHWVKRSGPAQGAIISPNAASTLVKGLVTGLYEFELTVIDSNGKNASDGILIIVYANPCTACWDY